VTRIRLGMVGGGRGAFIGSVHRMAARLDDQFELVAGALSSDPARADSSAVDLGIAADRAYPNYQQMAESESARPDGIEAVSIVTPNDTHAAVAKAFLSRGIHVICDKPLACNVKDASEVAQMARDARRILAVTYNYTGYPMVRQAREMCRSGELGALRLVEVHYLQDWLTERLEAAGSKQAEWRTDPGRAGPGGAIADIGSHAYHLTRFVTGLAAAAVCAELTSFVTGRRVDDDARVLLRFEGNAKGLLWASQVAPGNDNNLAIRVYGEKGGLFWSQEDPNRLWHSPFQQPQRCIVRGGAGAAPSAVRVTRLPAGHSEGFLEAFGTLYTEIADAIRAARQKTAPAREVLFPTAEDGVEGVRFIEAAVRSSAEGCTWQTLKDDCDGVPND
jgi:predicted dehydrogenase